METKNSEEKSKNGSKKIEKPIASQLPRSQRIKLAFAYWKQKRLSIPAIANDFKLSETEVAHVIIEGNETKINSLESYISYLHNVLQEKSKALGFLSESIKATLGKTKVILDDRAWEEKKIIDGPDGISGTPLNDSGDGPWNPCNPEG